MLLPFGSAPSPWLRNSAGINYNAGLVGIGTNAPTHSLTFSSTATGFAIYNTSDQVTNYERGRMFWNGNVLKFMIDAGGTGTVRNFRLGTTQSGTDDTYIEFSAGGSPKFNFTRVSNTSLNLIGISYNASASSGMQYTLMVTPTIKQSGTAGYAALYVNPTESTLGSGTSFLAQFAVGGVLRLTIRNDGVLFPVQQPTTSAPTYTKGGIYFDTTLNKLRIGGATGWETITSS